MNWIVITLSIVVVVGLVVWLGFGRKHPENAASHREPDRTGSRLFYGDLGGRPAGPGAEADGVAGRGEPVPGPSAENLGASDTQLPRERRG